MAEIEHKNRDYCPECGVNQRNRAWYVGKDLGNGQYQAVCLKCSLKYDAFGHVTESVEDKWVVESLIRTVNQQRVEIEQLKNHIAGEKQAVRVLRREFLRLQQNYDLLKAELEEREE